MGSHKSLVTAAIVLSMAAVMLSSCERAMSPVHTLLFQSGDEGSKFYRIPALTTASDGSLIAVADRRNNSTADLPNAIDVVARRSTDRGVTWGPQIVIARHTGEQGFGDAAIVLEKKSGDLVTVFCGGVGIWASANDVPADIYTSRSKDNGETWSEPRCITSSLYAANCDNPASNGYSAAFAASGSMTQFSDGTLAFVLAALPEDHRLPFYNHVCISTDGGETWELTPGTPGRCGDESKVAELSDGSWLMSIRHPEPGQRRYSLSHDRGLTWEPYSHWPEITDPACNEDLINYDRKTLLHSYLDSPSNRENVAVAVSYDDGKTWPVRKRIWEEDVNTGYSSLTVLDDGSIGLLTETNDGTQLWFSRFNLAWLEGK